MRAPPSPNHWPSTVNPDSPSVGQHRCPHQGLRALHNPGCRSGLNPPVSSSDRAMWWVRLGKPRAVPQAFEPTIDRLCRAVARTGAVEERQDVIAAPGQGAAQRGDLDRTGGNGGADRLDPAGHDLPPLSPAGGAVGGDRAPVCSVRRAWWSGCACDPETRGTRSACDGGRHPGRLRPTRS